MGIQYGRVIGKNISNLITMGTNKPENSRSVDRNLPKIIKSQTSFCCSWNGECPNKKPNAWCNKSKKNCEGACTGKYIPIDDEQDNEPEPYCCSWVGNCPNDDSNAYCNRNKKNCEGPCNGKYIPRKLTTKAPTSTPTTKPTSAPSKKPTSTPTTKPTSTPTTKPTSTPTTKPTNTPSLSITDSPSFIEDSDKGNTKSSSSMSRSGSFSKSSYPTKPQTNSPTILNISPTIEPTLINSISESVSNS